MLGSKTPYPPAPEGAALEPAPAGFAPAGLQLVARHGSRGLTKPGPEQRLLQLCERAAGAGALSAEGQRLPALLARFAAAQQRIGYGNLSALGVREQQQLARRLVARLPALFAAADAAPEVLLQSSGVDRAVDSARQFAAALGEAVPRLRVAAAPTADRFLLYFHRLSAERDGAAADTPARRETLARSQRYQAWLRSPELAAQQQRIEADARRAGAARASLAPLFGADFVEQLGAEGRQRAAEDLMDLRGAAADLRLELGDATAQAFQDLLPADALAVFAELADAEDFYRKGPGLAQGGDVTFAMAGQLLDSLLAGLDGAEPRLRLRFAHAEIVAPLVSRIGIAGVHVQQPASTPYSWAGNPWRTAAVIPMAANVQWELWQGVTGERLVRQLLNEREADFDPACEVARWRPGSGFYRVAALRVCYEKLTAATAPGLVSAMPAAKR
ncbi:MAG: histidine-type phosphatase [Burkholderiaceae bacterium]